jgi:dihydroorotate dehydrogenase
VTPVFYEAFARPVLFRLGGGNPETAHDTTLKALGALARRPALTRAARRIGGPRGAGTTVFGVHFPGPVGLAGGLDKNGVALPAWPALGFGFAEVGTVTRHPQPGNPQPRLFRLRESRAVINRMGFNNAGAEALAARLEGWGPLPVPLGISLGKSKITPLEDAVGDYLASLRALYRFGDYFAVNVSSPNTPGLRSLQDAGQLGTLLGELQRESRELAAGLGEVPAPLLVKIAPDLTEPAIADLLAVCAEHGVAGVIATNTTLSRDGLAAADQPRAAEAGGLSGRPLTALSLRVVRFVCKETGGKLPVIGAGGILDPEDAGRMFDAGASLVQVYTGLLYRGPGLVRGITRLHRRRAAAGSRPPALDAGTPAAKGNR